MLFLNVGSLLFRQTTNNSVLWCPVLRSHIFLVLLLLLLVVVVVVVVTLLYPKAVGFLV